MTTDQIEVVIVSDDVIECVIAESVAVGIPIPGPGLPDGGDPGQIPVKQSTDDYDTAWEDPAASGVSSVNGHEGDVELTAADVGAPTTEQLASEAASRAVADTAEAAARADADEAEADARSTAVSNEATTRATAISSEATTRAAADTAEATTRANADALLIPKTDKGVAGGVATLGGDGKLSPTQLPSIAINDFLGVVGSQAAMLALTGQRGDWCIRSDTPDGSSAWVIIHDDPSQLANWEELPAPIGGGDVSSVNGRIGDVVGLAEQSDLDAETSRAEAAESGIASDLATEISDRTADVASEASARATAISSEATTRASADSALSTSISSEASTRASADSALSTAIGTKADDSAVVHKTSAETIAGVKTFSTAPVVPDASFSEAKIAGLVADLAAKLGLTVFTAKGQLLAATAAGAAAVVPPAADGQLLVYDSSKAHGIGARPFTRPVFSNMVLEGDSWTTLPGMSNGYGGVESNWCHVVAAWLGVSENEVTIWGSSGAAAAYAYDATLLFMGSGKLVRHHVPTHWEGRDQFTGVAAAKARKGLTILSFTLNDLVSDLNAGALDQIQNAMLNGYRTMTSKVRVARQWPASDASIVYAQGSGASNGWGNQNNGARTYFPNNGDYESTAINGNIFTVTVPPAARAGTMVVLLQGMMNIYMTLASASAGVTSPTTLTVNDASKLPASGGVYVPLAGGGTVLATYSSKSGNVVTFDTAGATAMSGKTTAATGTAVNVGAAITRLASASGGATSPTTITVTDASLLNTADAVIVRLTGGQTVRVTYSSKSGNVLTLDSGGIAALSGKTLAPAGSVVQQDQGAGVTWSGTLAAAGGRTLVGGQGVAGAPCHVVARFPITGADAGKTLIGTLSNLIAGLELCVVGGWWIEDDDPPPVLHWTKPLYPYFGWPAGAYGPPLTQLNAAVVSLYNDEFPANTIIADYAARFASLWGATIKTATSTGTTVDITPNDIVNCQIAPGETLRCELEEMFVTAIDKVTIAPDWRLTVQRATSPEATAYRGTNVNHAVGVGIFGTRAVSTTDRDHPSEYGHSIIAGSIIDALAAYIQTTAQQVSSGTLIARRQPRYLPNQWIGPRTGSPRAGSATPSALDRAHAWRIPIYEETIITSFNMYLLANAAAGGTLQFYVWGDGPGRPGYLIHDSGAVAIDSGSVARRVTVAAWKKIRPQHIWIGWAMHGTIASATFRGISAPYIGADFSDGSAPDSNYTDPTCAIFSAPAGAGPNGAFITELTGNVPWMWLGVHVPTRD